MSEMDWSKMSMATMWRDWVVKSEQQWSEAMSRMLKNKTTGGALTRQIDEARMMHKMFGEMAQMALAAANLPSRTDFEALDERLGRIEDGMSGTQAELARLRAALAGSGAIASAAGAAPTRTRRPVRKAAAVASPTKTSA